MNNRTRARQIAQGLHARGDDLSMQAAEILDGLLDRTAIYSAWTYEPTGERVHIYAPDMRSLELTGKHPDALLIATGAVDAVSRGQFNDDAPKTNIPEWLASLEKQERA